MKRTKSREKGADTKTVRQLFQKKSLWEKGMQERKSVVTTKALKGGQAEEVLLGTVPESPKWKKVDQRGEKVEFELNLRSR